jgi:RNA polymerase sigma-70 factor (ECF subfamily)
MLGNSLNPERRVRAVDAERDSRELHIFSSRAQNRAAFVPFRWAPSQCSMSEFETIYATHAAAVFRYALKCVGRRDVAEDIVSEVFLALHRNMSTVDPNQLPGWLFAVAKHRAIDYWRHAQVEQRYLETLPPAETTWEPSVEIWLRQTKALKQVHRACLILRYVHGMDRAAIARRLGLTETQVKGHLQYALTILRRELEKTT